MSAQPKFGKTKACSRAGVKNRTFFLICCPGDIKYFKDEMKYYPEVTAVSLGTCIFKKQ